MITYFFFWELVSCVWDDNETMVLFSPPPLPRLQLISLLFLILFWSCRCSCKQDTFLRTTQFLNLRSSPPPGHYFLGAHVSGEREKREKGKQISISPSPPFRSLCE